MYTWAMITEEKEDILGKSLQSGFRAETEDVENSPQSDEEAAPEDAIPDLPENREAREFLKKAPTKGLVIFHFRGRFLINGNWWFNSFPLVHAFGQRSKGYAVLAMQSIRTSVQLNNSNNDTFAALFNSFIPLEGRVIVNVQWANLETTELILYAKSGKTRWVSLFLKNQSEDKRSTSG